MLVSPGLTLSPEGRKLDMPFVTRSLVLEQIGSVISLLNESSRNKGFRLYTLLFGDLVNILAVIFLFGEEKWVNKWA